jgi:DNA ligase-1
MRAFAQLYAELDQSTSTLSKVAALKRYFVQASPEDAAWAAYVLAGGKLRQLVPTRVLRETACALTRTPDWLFEESYQSVGDLAETIALLLGAGHSSSNASLSDWMARLEACRGLEETQVSQRLAQFWQQLDTSERFVMNKLITGGFRVGVSKLLVIRALAEAFALDAKVIAQRMMGFLDSKAAPSGARYTQLIAPEGESADVPERQGQPFPFYLAQAWPDEDPLPEPISAWQIEWKWDGIRAQLVARHGDLFIWSRGEELITERFPELAVLAPLIREQCGGAVIDGELVVWDHAREQPASFNQLQTRLNRKVVGRKLLQESPVVLLAYDLLELNGQDLRNTAQAVRRTALEDLLAKLASPEGKWPPIRLSPVVQVESWDAARQLREQSRARGVEGFMLKHRDSTYGVGRTRVAQAADTDKAATRSGWWKWKVGPITIDAVLIYAQKGHGRRANLYSDYTFALWDREAGEEPRSLVPFAKAYSGLTDEEMKQVDAVIRKTTRESFGPVRSVEPTLVFELGFEAINRSNRHKSGVAVRFPRMLRIRSDKPIQEADCLPNLLRLAT